MKKIKRGYNQCDYIASGIADALKIKIEKRTLKRIKRKKSQTKKGRFQRWRNVSGIFQFTFNKPHSKHILIIDDVITTGSTLESAIDAIQLKGDVKISIATLARSG